MTHSHVTIIAITYNNVECLIKDTPYNDLILHRYHCIQCNKSQLLVLPLVILYANEVISSLSL